MAVQQPGARIIQVIDEPDVGIRFEEQTRCIVETCFCETYSNERIRQELSEDVEDIPLQPLSRDLTRQRSAEYNEYVRIGRRLQETVPVFENKIREPARQRVRELGLKRGVKISELYEPFKGVVQGLFEEEISMAGVGVLMVFGYEFAKYLLKEKLGERMSDVINILVRFIHTEKISVRGARASQTIAEWVANNGGWIEVFNNLADVPYNVMYSFVNWKLACFTGVNLLMVTAFWLRKG